MLECICHWFLYYCHKSSFPQSYTCLHSGVLYYGDQAANGVKASDFVTELHSKADLDKFVNGQPDNVLTVVDVSLRNAAPCIHIFPAVLALAKNFTGFAHFSRLIGDESEEAQHLLKELNVNEVGDFLPLNRN